MQIFTKLTSLNQKFSGISIALGTFDGIHTGHQKIISRAVELARQINGTSMVLTFSNHPLSVVAPQHCPQQLVTQEYKAELIENLGVDVLLNLPFTPQFLQLSATEFIHLTLGNLSPKHIVVGPNYFFGYKRSGTAELLQEAGNKYGFNVEIHPTVYVDDVVVSSTLIRQLIAAGKVDQAAHLLGRPLALKGTVIHGDKRGRQLGYPTINLKIPNHLILPTDGVYGVVVTIHNIEYKGVANIGNNPTFNGIHRRLEVHLLDFDDNVYGQIVTVSFLKKIRGQITFSNAEQLKVQIFEDVLTAKQYFSSIMNHN